MTCGLNPEGGSVVGQGKKWGESKPQDPNPDGPLLEMEP
jgi:hypothetical protein